MSGQAQSMDSKKLWGGGRSPYNVGYGKMMMWFFLISDAFTFSAFLISYGFFRHVYENLWASAETVFTHFPFMHGDNPLIYVAFMTFVLIMSSVTMVLAVEAGQRMDKKSVAVWMLWTIVGGLIFVGSQAWEWYHFIHGTAEGAMEVVTSFTHGGIDYPSGTVLQFVDGVEGAFQLPGKNGDIISGPEAAVIVDGANHIHGANLTHNEYGHPLFGDFFFFITGFHGSHVFSGVVINFIIFVNVLMGTYEKRGHYEMIEKVGLYWHFVDLVWVFVFTFFYLV